MRVATVLSVAAAMLLIGCSGVHTHERGMRASEKTMLSEDVSERLAEADDGEIDIREHDDIKCDRIRITGSHLVTRVCYTTTEDEYMGEMSQDRLERIMNDTPRPRGEGRGPG